MLNIQVESFRVYRRGDVLGCIICLDKHGGRAGVGSGSGGHLGAVLAYVQGAIGTRGSFQGLALKPIDVFPAGRFGDLLNLVNIQLKNHSMFISR
jgi:hypothetical protein